MKETQETVGQWAVATFPGGDDLSPRHCLRLLEEVVELCLAAGAAPFEAYQAMGDRLATGNWMVPNPEPEKVPEEMADVQIVLYTIAHRRGIDLDSQVTEKMARNRRRTWKSNGDGTGYHVREGPES